MAMDKHRVALVTGGMGGLGEAICVKLAALGYTFHVQSGDIDLHYNVATQPMTWGKVKSLYRN